jgi:hypothetical protein
MSVGLGKNSPIVLSLGKSNYESMLARHGQNVRWMVAKKCTCVLENNRVDPKCKKCNGSGEIYDYQKEFIDNIRIRIIHGVAELPMENIGCEIIRAYDNLGVDFTPIQMGQFVEFENPKRNLINGETVDLIIKQATTNEIEEAALEHIGNGFYRVPNVLADRSTLEGVDYRAPGDLIGIDAVFDRDGNEIDIFEYRNDTVRLNDKGANHPLTAFGIKFLKPYKFFVLSQNLNDEDEALLKLHQGDAVSTFQYKYKISEGDVITVLSGANTRKTIIKRRHADYDDILPDYFVSGVSYFANSQREFIEGADFIIVGANKIHWLCDPPIEGDNLSVTYEYYPTYRVHKSVPQLRTSEDQRIPRKAVLKLFAAFQESRGVNQQRATS